jgi:hypothetical protein
MPELRFFFKPPSPLSLHPDARRGQLTASSPSHAASATTPLAACAGRLERHACRRLQTFVHDILFSMGPSESLSFPCRSRVPSVPAVHRRESSEPSAGPHHCRRPKLKAPPTRCVAADQRRVGSPRARRRRLVPTQPPPRRAPSPSRAADQAVAPADPFRFPPRWQQAERLSPPFASKPSRAGHSLSSPRATPSAEVKHEPLPVPFQSPVTSSSSHRSRPAEASLESRAAVERIPCQPPRASASPRWTLPPRAMSRRSELSLPPSPGSTTETERPHVPEAAAGALSLPSSTSWSSVR